MAYRSTNNTGPTRKDCLVALVIVVVMLSLLCQPYWLHARRLVSPRALGNWQD